MQEGNLVEKMLHQNILRRAHGFEVRTVSASKLEEWLNPYELDWIKNTAEKAKIKMYSKMKMEIAKLSILIRYGGIWLSRHLFAL